MKLWIMYVYISSYQPVTRPSSPNTADVLHVTISVTMFPVSSLLLVGTVLYLVMFSVTAFSGSGWFRGRDRVTELLAWLMARNGPHLLSSQQLALHQHQLCTTQWGSQYSRAQSEIGVMYTEGVRKSHTIQCT